MSISIALIWLVAGIVIGAIASRFYSLRQFNQHKLQLELDESRQQLQQYRSDVSSHLDTTHQLMAQLQDNYEKIARHMARTKMQLIERPGFSQDTDLNYLSTDTAEHIRMSLGKIDEKRRKKIEPQAEQPLDYAGHSSGIMKTFPAQKNSGV
ncbi:hypothetical protein A5320_15735 [Rheinheimera sp. SA_1]|jgi:uncharacterized membrane-anchored protein YhcB (DUF1043 family)|uniref:YhcB family protein n=1 Tax=Rheinheimera sp. SA_1 TaxID=1827365 RepID=UPI0007FEFE33|nr:YhcB family protein [Rheinheimera sp. SA_1]OBP14103.1 hypothetical protein A5320_15735 [Rheinheimera sp. SA_1]